MSTLQAAKYVIYRCDACVRLTQLALDGRRPDPVHCNITLNCRGSLRRVGERQTKEFLFTPPVVGLDDYRPRGNAVATAAEAITKSPVLISTTDDGGVITIAAMRSLNDGINQDFYAYDGDGNPFIVESLSPYAIMPDLSSIVAVLYEIPQVLLNSRSYTYQRQNSVPFIDGPDDSMSRLNLRFTADNAVTVFINGVELDPSMFDRSINDKVTFTPMISDLNNLIEIIVASPAESYITADSPNIIRLNFRPLRVEHGNEVLQRRLNAWGDVTAARVDDGERFLLFCTETVAKLLPLKYYKVAWFETTSILTGETKRLAPESIYVLLGREPFTFEDKELYAYVPGNQLIDSQFFYTTSNQELTIAQEAVSQVYNPITPLVYLSITSLTSSSGAETEINVGTEELARTYVIGPR